MSTHTDWLVLLAALAINAASLALILWSRRERRRIQELRYGATGSAFNETLRTKATERLRR